jgi:hypothetical protein
MSCIIVTGEDDLVENILYRYHVTPIELSGSILRAENKDELDTLYANETVWKEIMKEEIEKFDLDP